MVFAKGGCSHFTVSGQSYPCFTVVNSHFPNGRTAWSIILPHGSLMLAGGRESRPDPTTYVLRIDHLQIGEGEVIDNRFHPVKGACTGKFSADGAYLRSLSCSAKGAAYDVQLEFEGDGSQVTRLAL